MRSLQVTFSVLALLTAACSDATGPGAGGNVRLLIAAGAPASAGSPAQLSETYSLGGTTIEFTRVQLVLREIELKRTEASSACEGESQSGRSDDDCEEFEFGPVLLDLPLDGAPDQVVTIDAAAGTYRELEFKVHKPGDDNRDGSFLAQHPDFQGVSIRAEGRWNGTPFVYITDLSAEQEVALMPPLTIEAEGSTDLTLRVDLQAWFLDGGRTAFVNPATANKGQPRESLVKENIKRSFDAFEDDDHDGERD